MTKTLKSINKYPGRDASACVSTARRVSAMYYNIIDSRNNIQRNYRFYILNCALKYQMPRQVKNIHKIIIVNRLIFNINTILMTVNP
jgi:hypothetical protein